MTKGTRKRKRLFLEAIDGIEESYEKNKRTSASFDEEIKRKFKLPIVLPTGESQVVYEGNSKKDISNKSGNFPGVCEKLNESCDDTQKVSTLSNTQRKRLEKFSSTIKEKKKKLQKDTNQEKEKAFIQKCLSETKTYSDVLKQITIASELLLANPVENSVYFDFLFSIIKGAWDTLPCLSLNKSQHLSKKTKPSILALLSMGSVLQNCVSGYKLRPELVQDGVSTAVARTKFSDEKFLEIYKEYINILFTQFHDKANVITPIASGLLQSSPFYNESIRLLRYVISTASFRHSENDVCANTASQTALNCLETLIIQDSSLDVALGIITELSKIIKEKSKHLSKKTVIRRELLLLLVRIEFDTKEALVSREEFLRGSLSKKHTDTQVYKEIMQSSIYGSLRDFKTKKNEILTQICVIFLGVLRDAKHYSSEVLDACIEALGHLGKHVCTDLLLEMLEKLKQLSKSDEGHFGPGVMFTAISSIVRMSSLLAAKTNFQTDVHWIMKSLMEAIYLALPCFTSSPNSISITYPPVELFNGQKCNSTLYETKNTNHPEFFKKFQTSLAFILQHTNLFTTTSNILPKELIELIQCLMSMVCNVADPVCRLGLFNIITEYIKKYPSLLSIMDKDGVILYGTGQEVTLFWTCLLLKTWRLPKTETCLKLEKIFSGECIVFNTSKVQMKNVHPIIQWFNTYQRETEQLFKKESKCDYLKEKSQSGSYRSTFLLLPTLKHLENTGINEAFVDAHIIQSVDTEDCYINRLGHCLSFKEGFIYGIWGFSYQVLPTEIRLASIVKYENVCLSSERSLVGILIDRPIPIELKLPRPLACHAESSNAKLEWLENDENVYLTEEKVEECIKEWSELYPIFKKKLYRDLNFFKNKFLLIPGCSSEVASKIKKLTHESLATVLYCESLKNPSQSAQSFSDVVSCLCNKKLISEKVSSRHIMAHILHRYFYKSVNNVLWMYMERETNQMNQALRFYIDSIINQSTNSEDIKTKQDDLNSVVRSLVHWLNLRGMSDVTLLSHLLHPNGLVQKLQKLESTGNNLSPFEKQCYFIELQNEINMTVLKFIKNGKSNYESALPCAFYPSEKLFTPSSLCLLLSLCLTRPYCQLPIHTAHMCMLLYNKEPEDFPNYTALTLAVKTLEVFFQHAMDQVYTDD